MWDANGKVLAQELALYKSENGDRMGRLERSNVSVVITVRGLQRSVDALATKEGVGEHSSSSRYFGFGTQATMMIGDRGTVLYTHFLSKIFMTGGIPQLLRIYPI